MLQQSQGYYWNSMPRSLSSKPHSATSLGLDLIAFRTNETRAQTAGFRGGSADENSNSVSPGEQFRVHVHASQSTSETQLEKVWLESRRGDEWKNDTSQAGQSIRRLRSSDPIFNVHVADNARPTAPFFTRPSHRAAILRHREIRSGASAPSRLTRSTHGPSSLSMDCPFAWDK